MADRLTRRDFGKTTAGAAAAGALATVLPGSAGQPLKGIPKTGLRAGRESGAWRLHEN